MSKSRKVFLYFFIAASFLFFGFIVTFPGFSNLDSPEWMNLSYSFIRKFPFFQNIKTNPAIIELNKWYAPLPPLLFLFLEQPFRFLNDPYWVRHAWLWMFFPSTLLGTFFLLIRAGIKKSTAFLSVAFILGCVRLWGHAIHNFSDLPLCLSYLFSTVFLWVSYLEVFERVKAKKPVKIGQGILIGAFACLPFLTRPPMGLHMGIVVALSAYLFLTAALPLKQRLKLLVPILTIPIVIYSIYTPLWEHGFFKGMWKSLVIFSDYPVHRLYVRYFGETYFSRDLPWYYCLTWLPIITHPFAFFSVVIGLLTLPFTRVYGKRLDLRFKHSISIKAWLAFFSFAPLAVLLILQPTLYDEERHFLFTFPPLLMLASLGLDFLKPKIKIASGVLIIGISGALFLKWGIYSSVYKSPVLGQLSRNHSFTGDYWSLCANEAPKAINQILPKGSRIAVIGGDAVISVQNRRYTHGLLTGDPNYGPYTFITDDYKTPYLFIVNRNLRHLPVLFDVSWRKTAKILWEKKLPNGETACLLAEYFVSNEKGEFERGHFMGN